MTTLNTKEALANAEALLRSGNTQGAFELYQQIAQENPKATEAWYQLGQMSTSLQRYDLAENFYLKALEWDKRNPDYYNGLGEARLGGQDFDGARLAFDKALKRRPSSTRALNNMGRLLQQQGQYDAAEHRYRKALRLAPKDTAVMLNLSTLQIESGKFEQAVSTLKKALQLEPDNCLLRYNLTRAYADSGESELALKKGGEMLTPCATHPVAPLTHIIMGNASKAQLEFDRAESHYLKAIELTPNQVEPHSYLGVLRLIMGKLETGWPEVAWEVMKNRDISPFQQPLWKGEPLAGKRLTYIAEQGLGDEIMFANLIPDLAQQAEHCLVECDERLIPLYRRSFPDVSFVPRQLPPHPELSQHGDYLTWGSAAAAQLRNNIDQFPNQEGYLKASTEKVERWKQWLEEIDDNRKVGICWRSMMHSTSRGAYPDITRDWAELLKLKDLTFINLQYDDCAQELATVREEFGITIHVPPTDLKNDQDEVAALIVALDRVISSHTAVAQLSGALGQKTVILTGKHNWTRLGGEHFPWYPSARGAYLAPQQSWKACIDTLATELQQEQA